MSVIKFFDKLEDRVRFSLSRRPILYAFISGIGTVLFFRGVWMIADDMPFLTGPVTLVLSLIILLLTGAFVFHFLSSEIVVSGAKRQKKMVDRSAAELRSDVTLQELHKKLEAIEYLLGSRRRK